MSHNFFEDEHIDYISFHQCNQKNILEYTFLHIRRITQIHMIQIWRSYIFWVDIFSRRHQLTVLATGPARYIDIGWSMWIFHRHIRSSVYVSWYAQIWKLLFYRISNVENNYKMYISKLKFYIFGCIRVFFLSVIYINIMLISADRKEHMWIAGMICIYSSQMHMQVSDQQSKLKPFKVKYSSSLKWNSSAKSNPPL